MKATQNLMMLRKKEMRSFWLLVFYVVGTKAMQTQHAPEDDRIFLVTRCPVYHASFLPQSRDVHLG